MSSGLKRLVVGVVGVLAAVAGVAIVALVTTDSNGGLKPYGLPETLPQMVSSFGANAHEMASEFDAAGEARVCAGTGPDPVTGTSGAGMQVSPSV